MTALPTTPSVETALHALRADDLAGDVFRFRDQVAHGGVAVLRTTDAAIVAAALSTLDGWAAEVSLIPPSIGTGGGKNEPPHSVTELDWATLHPARSTASDDRVATRWNLFTSGTTGEPKAIGHSIESLTRTITSRRLQSSRWGLLYDPNRMAGIQVILHALRSQSVLVAPSLDAPLGERIAVLNDSGVDSLSATPSIWRQILQTKAIQKWGLRQITLGGEIADQKILDALARSFPTARIVHVFASTETGAAFSVTDGREGFPVAFLDEAPKGIRLEVRSGVLHVFNPDATAAKPDGFVSTGDVVEIEGDRVLFKGRESGVVNIGGSNVWPEHVEAILRSHPRVLEAVVSGRPNAMTGHVLVARVATTDAGPHDELAKQLRSWVRERAPRTHVPAMITVQDHVEISSTGKIER